MKKRKRRPDRSSGWKKAALIIAFLCIAGIAILLFGGTKNNDKALVSASETTQAPMENGVVCVFYAGTWLSLDKDGVVCANNSLRPEDIPEITGIEFEDLAYGRKADPVEQKGLEYLIRIACSLEKHDLSVDRISYENRKATLYIGKLRVELGKEDNTDEKLTDLSDLIDNIAEDSGTLYMQNGDASNYGYTFRADP